MTLSLLAVNIARVGNSQGPVAGCQLSLVDRALRYLKGLCVTPTRLAT